MFIFKKLYPFFKKNAIISLVIIFQFAFIFYNVQAVTVLEYIKGQGGNNQNGLLDTAEKSGFFEGTPSASDPVSLIGTYVQYFLSFMGVIFLGLMIYGGYIWMKARGNDSEATKAKGIMMDSGIGLVIIFSAYVISNFIISNLAGSTAQ
jgi:hypothetical protein